MHKTRILDLNFQGEKNIINAFLVSDDQHNVLIETGPESCFKSLEKGLAEFGLEYGNLDLVLPTHIHLDHAGGAWKICERGIPAVFHPEGAKHMMNPEKLYDSAKRIYGERMDTLWGQLKKIEERNIVIANDLEEIKVGKMSFLPIFTPGHAKHHIVWAIGGDFFVGDLCGCKILEGPCEVPVPPPDLDFEVWEESLKKIRSLNPGMLHLTHSGSIENPAKHLDEVEKVLGLVKALSKEIAWRTDEIDEKELELGIARLRLERMNQVGAAKNPALVKKYGMINPDWMSALGLKRYWARQRKTQPPHSNANS